MRPRSLTTRDVGLIWQKDATSLGDFQAFSNGMTVTTSRYKVNEQVERMSSIWIVIPGGAKDQVT